MNGKTIFQNIMQIFLVCRKTEIHTKLNRKILKKIPHKISHCLYKFQSKSIEIML